MQKRTLIKVGIAGAVLLAAGGGFLALSSPGLVQGRLSVDARAMFQAVAEAVLHSALPPEGAARQTAIDAHLRRLESTITGFPPALQAEVAQLATLLSSTPGRLAMVGLTKPWRSASPVEVREALQSLRVSSLPLRQQVFHALRDLSNAAFFADPSAWAVLGYPGPRTV